MTNDEWRQKVKCEEEEKNLQKIKRDIKVLKKWKGE